MEVESFLIVYGMSIVHLGFGCGDFGVLLVVGDGIILVFNWWLCSYKGFSDLYMVWHWLVGFLILITSCPFL